MARASFHECGQTEELVSSRKASRSTSVHRAKNREACSLQSLFHLQFSGTTTTQHPGTVPLQERGEELSPVSRGLAPGSEIYLLLLCELCPSFRAPPSHHRHVHSTNTNAKLALFFTLSSLWQLYETNTMILISQGEKLRTRDCH